MDRKKIQRPVFESPFINITINPDGTLNRKPWPRNPPNPDPTGSSPVLSKDVVLDPNKKTWIRLYIPKLPSPPPPNNKLPLILFYHGGGFVFCNADTRVFDVFCKGLVRNINAMVISLDYRLAPENRLPAAYDDAVDAFHWIVRNSEHDDWVKNYADLNNCFLFGSSSGANIAYHAGYRLLCLSSSESNGLAKLKIRGLILNQPYFSGKKRTGSELKLEKDPLLPLSAIDEMFDLSLPEGADDHDHEYCNPLKDGESSKIVDEIKRSGWRVIVAGCYDDPLVDAGMDLANMFERKGVETVKFFSEGYHAMEIFQPSRAGPLYDAVKGFIFMSTKVQNATSRL